MFIRTFFLTRGAQTLLCTCIMLFISFFLLEGAKATVVPVAQDIRHFGTATSGFFLSPPSVELDSSPNDEYRLLNFLMRGYEASVRPVLAATGVTNVKIGLTVTHIFKMDEKNQVLSLNVWLEHEWYDERFIWLREEFGNISQLTVPTRYIWLPDIVLLNNAQDYQPFAQTNVNIYDDGRVLWAPPMKLKSICRLDVTFFPFDDQICHLRFGSWIYDASQIDLSSRFDRISLDSYIDNGEWAVLATGVKKRYYQTAKSEASFPELVFHIHLRRRVLYYLYNIVIPCMMLSVLTLMQFRLPAASGEKIALGLTVVLAYSVFSFNIGENMPETSDVIPLIAIYIMAIMGMSSLSVVFSVIVLNLHHATGYHQKVPSWIRFIACKVLAPYVYSGWAKDLHRQRMRKKSLCATEFLSATATELSTVRSCPLAQAEQDFSDTEYSPPTTRTPLTYTSSGSFAKLRRPLVHRPVDHQSSTCSKRSVVFSNLERMANRSRLLLEATRSEVATEMRDLEWQIIGRIFDRFFFWLTFVVTGSVTLLCLVILPMLNRYG